MSLNLTNQELDLLAEVVKEKEFYTTLSESEESNLLRILSSKELVKWCPYPEEFYILTPAGKKMLEKRSVKVNLETPFYKGSVQNLYSVLDHPELLVSETTSGGSVFDVGTIFSIEGSDVARAGFRHFIYQELQKPTAWHDLSEYLTNVINSKFITENSSFSEALSEMKNNGAKTHHIGMVEPKTGSVYSEGFPPEISNLTLIEKYNVRKPVLNKCMQWHFYDYHEYHKSDKYVIPLEYITRFGVTSGSSILRKYNNLSDKEKSRYVSELGLSKPLSQWQVFDAPILDFTTKYEPDDRNISHQEASLMAGISGEQFSKSIVQVLLASYLVHMLFNRMGLNLWDLKWEIAVDGDSLVFVDTIDTDSVRATLDVESNGLKYFVHFNKQAMRDYYKIIHSEWYAGVLEAKQLASTSGQVFTQILADGQKSGKYPSTPDVDREFINIQANKFHMIRKFILEGGAGKGYREEAKQIAASEVDYYLRSDRREIYQELNSVECL